MHVRTTYVIVYGYVIRFTEYIFPHKSNKNIIFEFLP